VTAMMTAKQISKLPTLSQLQSFVWIHTIISSPTLVVELIGSIVLFPNRRRRLDSIMIF
jgi:hypothetical protein